MAALANKVALITGAAQGIGLAATRLMLQHGAKVSMVDLNEPVGRLACSQLQGEFEAENVSFTASDVTKYDQLRQAFQKTKDTFGNIDIVCNNAGIGDEMQWKRMIAINLVAMIEGTFLGLEFLSRCKGGRGGVIVNVSSMGGIYPMPYAPAYCASKCGVVGFSRSMTNCLETDGVRVNCICPEFTETQLVVDMMSTYAEPLQTEQARQAVSTIGLLSCEEVARGILELVQEESRVGAVMTVTRSRGISYFRLPGDPKPQSRL